MFQTRLIFFSLITFIMGCSQKPQDDLIFILENKYANLYVNEAHKREVINELKDYLKTHELNDIKKLIHKLGDGHVIIENDTLKDKNTYLSGLEFYPGSNILRSCLECIPVLKPAKYKILEINNQPLNDYLKDFQYSVSASTPWAREYRILRNLAENSSTPDVKLKLLTHNQKEMTTTLRWKNKEITTKVCVSGERINTKTFKLNVLSLWCNDPKVEQESRQKILDRFKDQFQEIISKINQDDYIILDLRENGGGGDEETQYVLNAFNEQSVFMYKYKYLNKLRAKKWTSSFSNFLPTWEEEKFLYTNLANRPKHHLYQNKMVTLISSGCFSSCEGLASSLKFENRSKLLGTKTHGGIGEPIFMPILNSPYQINIPVSLTFQKNGDLFEGQGVIPDIEMTQDLSRLDDNVLEMAAHDSIP